MGWLLLNGFLRFNYPDATEFPVQGIDISHHQGTIDWRKIAGDRPGFVIMKATQGRGYRDPRFRPNWEAAGAAGIVRGAYHFFEFCTSGAVQARNFMGAVHPGQRMLPPAIDVEFEGNCERWPGPEKVRQELGGMIRLLERAYGRKPILYANYRAYDRIIAGHFEGCPIWIRDIFFRPRLSDGRPWLFWQYANNGRAAGISTRVDLDVFNGPPADLAGLCLSIQPKPRGDALESSVGIE